MGQERTFPLCVGEMGGCGGGGSGAIGFGCEEERGSGCCVGSKQCEM